MDEIKSKLEKFEICIFTELSKEFLLEAKIDFSYYETFAHDVIITRILQEVYGQRIGEIITIKYPADWKEAIKERFAPIWFLKRWPVRYNETILDLAELYPKWRPDTEAVVVNMSNKVDLSRVQGCKQTGEVC